MNLADSRMDCLQGTLSVQYLEYRVQLLEYRSWSMVRYVHEKAYKFIVCEFQNVYILRDACVHAIPT